MTRRIILALVVLLAVIIVAATVIRGTSPRSPATAIQQQAVPTGAGTPQIIYMPIPALPQVPSQAPPRDPSIDEERQRLRDRYDEFKRRDEVERDREPIRSRR